MSKKLSRTATPRPISASRFLRHPRRLTTTALAVGASAGLVGAVTEYSPQPPVSPTGTELLINANDALLDIGTPLLIGALAFGGGVQLRRRRNDRLDAMLDSTTHHDRSRTLKALRGALPAVAIAATATSLSIGDTAGRTANGPVNFLENATSTSSGSAIVLQHCKVVPFNASEITKPDTAKLATWAKSRHSVSTAVTPFVLRLGSLENPTRGTNNPSSAPIVALPNDNIRRTFNISLDRPDTTSPVPLIVGSQLAKRGDRVLIEQKPAIVAAASEPRVGLDRVSAIGSLEALEDEVLKSNTYTGSVVTGVASKKELQQALTNLGIDACAVSFEEFEQAYRDFWDHSVKPPEMQLALLIMGLGLIGGSFTRVNDTLGRRKHLALHNVLGVNSDTQVRAENLRSFQDSLRATLVATPIVYALTAITNSSQYGLDQTVNTEALGGALGLWLLASFASGAVANHIVKNMDVATELRA